MVSADIAPLRVSQVIIKAYGLQPMLVFSLCIFSRRAVQLTLSPQRVRAEAEKQLQTTLVRAKEPNNEHERNRNTRPDVTEVLR